MRIVCDNCGAKYQISDDKVRNKVFKIRCKRCAHVIVVRSQGDEEEAGLAGGADEDSTRVGNHPAPEPAAAREPSHEAPLPAADAVWYIVINREQVGPLTKAQIQGHLRHGEVDAEAFTWREGMPDWTRLGAIPEFAGLFPAPAAAEPVAPAPAPVQQRSPRPAAAAAPEPAPFGGNDGGFGALDQDDDVIASSHPAPGPEPVSAAAHDPRVSSHQLRNQRNENSVLFSLDSLAAEVDRPSSVRSTGGSDASGLIDISALAGGGGRSGGGDDPFGGGGGFAPISAAPVGSAMPILVKRRGMSTGAVVAIVAAVVLVVGGGAAAAIWYIKNQQQPAPVGPPVAAGSEAVRVGVAAATTPASAAASAAPSAAVASAVPSAPSSEVAAAPASAPESLAAAVPSAPATEAEEPAPTRRKNTASTKRSRASTRTARTRTPDPEDDPPARAPAPAATPRTAAPKKRGNSELDSLLGNLGNNQNGGARQGGGDPAPTNRNSAPAGDPMLPEKLSRQQVLQVVTKNAGSIRSCGQGGGGTVTVSMLIGRSGNVDDAKATGAQAGTPVGSCVEGKVRSFRFPQFSGEPMRINMPFAL